LEVAAIALEASHGLGLELEVKLVQLVTHQLVQTLCGECWWWLTAVVLLGLNALGLGLL